jgi:uncharacterized protein YigA (DUF484 family)
MRDLEDKIEEEQRIEDAKNRDYQDRCNSDLKELEKDDALLQRRIVEIQAVLDDLIPAKSKKETASNVKNMWKEELEGKIAELVAEREEEAKEYEQKMEEHDYASFVIETVRRMFTENSSQPSFLETQSTTASSETLKSV